MDSKNKSLYNIRSGGALFSAASFFPLLLSLAVSMVISIAGYTGLKPPYPDWYLYLNFLLPQLSFAIVAILFFRLVDVSPKQIYRVANWKYFIIAIIVQFGLFSLSGLNEYVLSLMGEYIGYSNEITLPSLENGGIIGVILVVALLPAIFEETIFRGLILNPLKKLSTPVAVVICGMLFSIYHHSPAQTIYQFICGMAFAFIAIRANSILPTILSHFLNNAVIIIFYNFGISDFGALGGTVFYVVSGIALVGSMTYLIFIDKQGNTTKTESVKPFFMMASVGILVCIVLWLTNLLNGMGIPV